jgi:hypothetical protein
VFHNNSECLYRAGSLKTVAREWRQLYNENFITCIFHQRLCGDQLNTDEGGGTCSTHKRDEKCINNFNKGIDHLEEEVIN